MDLEINYPYGIPYFSDIEMILFNIINNSQEIIYIYFFENKKKGKLANIVLPFSKKKFNFPKISIYLERNSKKMICVIKIKNGWTYIYP